MHLPPQAVPEQAQSTGHTISVAWPPMTRRGTASIAYHVRVLVFDAVKLIYVFTLLPVKSDPTPAPTAWLILIFPVGNWRGPDEVLI